MRSSQIVNQTHNAQPFYVPPSWEDAMSSVVSSTSNDQNSIVLKPPVVIIKGPKNSGKSTFARTLLNRLVIE